MQPFGIDAQLADRLRAAHISAAAAQQPVME
jgi:hypothetical protein